MPPVATTEQQEERVPLHLASASDAGTSEPPIRELIEDDRRAIEAAKRERQRQRDVAQRASLALQRARLALRRAARGR